MNMRILATLLFCTICFHGIRQTPYDTGWGTLNLPDNFSLKRTGTADSCRGELRRESDGFLVRFDVGFMAGFWVGPDEVSDEGARILTMNNQLIRIALKKHPEGVRARATIYESTDWAPKRKAISEELNRLSNATDSEEVALLLESYRRHTRNILAPANFSAAITEHEDLLDFLAVVSGYRSASVEQLRNVSSNDEIKISFKQSWDEEPEGRLPKEARMGGDQKAHSTLPLPAFGLLISNQFKQVQVTWMDQDRLTTREEAKLFLRKLMANTFGSTWRFQIWSQEGYGGSPLIAMEVTERSGKKGKWVIAQEDPTTYSVYRNGDGKWWFSSWRNQPDLEVSR